MCKMKTAKLKGRLESERGRVEVKADPPRSKSQQLSARLELGRVRTIAAHGEGLTCIQLPVSGKTHCVLAKSDSPTSEDLCLTV